jgi:polyferredoxin
MFYYTSRRLNSLLRARDATLILGIIVIGIYLASPFSILHIFNLVLVRMSSSALWTVIVVSTFFSIVLAGRFYCGWLCPFGALAEFIGRLPFRKWDMSYQTDDRWRRLKYLLLLIIIAVVFTSRRTEYGNFETYVTLFSLHGNMSAWVFAIFMLVINIRVERFWCRYLCPVAAFTGLCSRKDSHYISRKDCPMANRPGPLISECIRCNRCYHTKSQ